MGLRFLHPRTGKAVELSCPLPDEFTAMLKDFPQVHFISGHSHQNMLCYGKDDSSRFPYISNITEHNISGVCGCWWQTAAHGGRTLSADGGPAGFEVFPVSGDKIEWYFDETGYSQAYEYFLKVSA